jgi:hypothetical protein
MKAAQVAWYWLCGWFILWKLSHVIDLGQTGAQTTTVPTERLKVGIVGRLRVVAGCQRCRAIPDRASVAAINADLAILNGLSDFTERMKRLSAIAPDIEIFGQRLVMRDDGGWQITDAGREFLRLIEPR